MLRVDWYYGERKETQTHITEAIRFVRRISNNQQSTTNNQQRSTINNNGTEW